MNYHFSNRRFERYHSFSFFIFRFLLRPVNGGLALFFQKGVDLRKGPAAEEAAVGGQGARVRRGEDQARAGTVDS